MITLHFWPTPNAYKVLIALEEPGLDYALSPVNIFAGEQFAPAFLAVSPNNRVPAITDDGPADGAGPLALFESGAILTYLAEKAGALAPSDPRGRAEVQQWLHWQMGGLGPNMGQAGHFFLYAPEDAPYAKKRFLDEVRRLFGVMERRLADRAFLAGAYSIADVACFPWIKEHARIPLSLDPHPRLAEWAAAIAERPAVVRAYAAGGRIGARAVVDEKARRILFGPAEEA